MEAVGNIVNTGTAEKAGLSKKKKMGVLAGSIAMISLLYFVYQALFYVTTDNAQVRANSVIISAKVGGFISKVLVEENQKVKSGEILAVIDTRDYESRTSEVENERASLEARARDAASNAQRLNQLFKEGAISQQQRDAAVATASELAGKLRALGSQVDQQKLNLAETQIRAPNDGVIARRSAEVGMLASPGTPLFGFVSSEARWIVANFKETELGDVAIGKPVDIKIDALKGKRYKGHVESLSPATGATFSLLPPDNATGNFTKVVQRVPVRIRMDQLTPEDIDDLKAGLSAEVKVHIH